jgi:hypothetical protein
MTMTTYYVEFTNDDGDNFDLFVFAEDPKDVPGYWERYYENGASFDALFGPLLTERPDDQDNHLRIFECPESGGQHPGAVDWPKVTQWWAPITWSED